MGESDVRSVVRSANRIASRLETEIKVLKKALRRLAIARHVRLTHGGGTVPSGGSCNLCKAEWDTLDMNNKPIDGKEWHKPGCLLLKAPSDG